ncbi:MAG: hypothetical protein IPK32_21455 [Verrucomicrobiaceae bacterium]|nr:hypothetical protein [Verrucomicrobiaceae bacterium]
MFGSPGVTSDRISRALAQFVRSIISVQSKYDAARAANFAIKVRIGPRRRSRAASSSMPRQLQCLTTARITSCPDRTSLITAWSSLRRSRAWCDHGSRH